MYGVGVSLKEELKQRAEALGFCAFGVAPIDAPLRQDYYLEWIAEGKHGKMDWMARNVERRTDVSKVLPEARSVICFGLNYYQESPDRRGRIARYALGRDYHKVILKKLKHLCRFLEEQGGEQKPYVDTGPILEKPFAVQAGLGWQAKSTLLLTPKEGPWLFLGEIITTLELEPDRPMNDHCGKCRACIDVCPTQAITGPYQLDARRCIAYLTIEHPGSIPLQYRKLIGDRLFGCDECLEVCPWNRFAQKTRENEFSPRDYPDLSDMLSWNEADFFQHFQGTPVYRLKLERWLRNVCVVLGNIGNCEDLPALEKSVSSASPLVAEHAAWAIKEIHNRNSY